MRKPLVTFAAGVLIGAACVLGAWAVHHRHVAQAPPPPADPLIAEPTRYLTAHEAFVERNKREQPGVVFLGDSIIDFWRYVPWIWDQHFGKYRPANFGIIFDRIGNALWRVENGELDGISPRVIVLLIGTNDLPLTSETDERIAAGIMNLVQHVQAKQPQAKVLLLGIFPRGQKPDDPIRQRIRVVNAMVRALDDGRRVRFLDIGGKLTEPDGSISPAVMPDYLHPGPEGFRQWAEAMDPLLGEMYVNAK